MTDYKQHCIKLLQILDTNWPLGLPTTWAKWADAVRADLAKPEPEGLTDEDLVETVRQSMEDCIFVSELLYYNREPLMHILRTVLARWGNHPESPDRLVQPELEEPSFGDVIEWVSGIEPWATWLAPGGCLENAHFEFERLVTTAVARWGSSQGILDSSTPQPVPVSKRLPGPEDCDAEGKCWWWYPEVLSETYGYWAHEDDAVPERALNEQPTHWLSVHALPLPS